MIYKSYLIENNLNILKNNIILFYGENEGLIDEFKNKIIKNYKNESIISFSQEELLADYKKFDIEISNKSLFSENKVFFINEVNDKILKLFKEIENNISKDKIFLFSKKLEKKSKLRALFEKENTLDIIPCYKDSDITIRNIISKSFNNYSGLTPEMINMISYSAGNSRNKLKNEIRKIKDFFFIEKIINKSYLEKILNLREDESFNDIKDFAINGDSTNTNKLLNTTFMESEKTIFYLTLITYRLSQLKEILDREHGNIEKIISEIKPPIFWKDRAIIIDQLKKWNREKCKKAINEMYNLEILLKSNSNINKLTLLKKSVIDVCNIAKAI